jgi:hypothetical protein
MYGASHPTNDFSLATKYPVEWLRTNLLPRELWSPFARISDREFWNTLPANARQRIVKAGEEAQAKPMPALPATLYLDYARTGNRSRFEAIYHERRSGLHTLVLGECVEAKGRFRDAIGNAIWAICEESSWCYPAHIGAQKDGTGLPEVTEPIVDLFAGETASSLAWTDYLLGTELDKVSRRIRPRIRFEIHRRILTPCLERDDFGWMGFADKSSARRPNNWNPWINASVLTATLAIETNAERRVQLVHKILRSLDRFVQPYPSDGSCDEGPGYWGHAGGSLLDCLELLASAHRDAAQDPPLDPPPSLRAVAGVTPAGKLDVFDHPLIQEIGRFIYRAHIDGGWFVPIGDCPAQLGMDRALVYRYGKRINEGHLKSLAGYGATLEDMLGSVGGRYLGRQLATLANLTEILALQPKSPPLVRDVWLGSEDMQMMAARTEAGSNRGWYVASWGGHNAQSHNHNDVGNFLVFADGQPVLVDVGAPTYTAQTFSSRRYEIRAMQSAYHNLPTINGVMQEVGRSYAARQVNYAAKDPLAELQMDIAGAYPDRAQVKSWVRTVTLNRGKDVEITDAFELDNISGVTSQNLITPLDVVVDQPGRLALKNAAAPGKPGTVILEYDGTKLDSTVEDTAFDDARLARVWGSPLHRIVLQPRVPVKKDVWKLRVKIEHP